MCRGPFSTSYAFYLLTKKLPTQFARRKHSKAKIKKFAPKLAQLEHLGNRFGYSVVISESGRQKDKPNLVIKRIKQEPPDENSAIPTVPSVPTTDSTVLPVPDKVTSNCKIFKTPK